MNTHFFENKYEEFAQHVDHIYKNHKNCHICHNKKPSCLVPAPYFNDLTFHFMCETCMNSLLSYYPNRFQKLQKREHVGK